MTRYFAILLIALAACQATKGLADDGPAKDVPELAALSNYIGIWNVSVTSKDSPFTKGESTAKWILDSRFLQQTGFISSEEGATVLRISTLMTYDQERKEYRMWSFLSDGTTSESAGRWDENNRTMTSIRRGGGTTTTTTAKFTDEGIEEWTMVTTNQGGDVVATLSGKNVRRKQ